MTSQRISVSRKNKCRWIRPWPANSNRFIHFKYISLSRRPILLSMCCAIIFIVVHTSQHVSYSSCEDKSKQKPSASPSSIWQIFVTLLILCLVLSYKWLSAVWRAFANVVMFVYVGTTYIRRATGEGGKLCSFTGEFIIYERIKRCFDMFDGAI